MTEPLLSRSERARLCVGITLASMFAGGFAGYFATALYAWDRPGSRPSSGAVFGIAAGAIVGVLWWAAMCRWTTALADDADCRDKLRRRGLLAGIGAGVVATLMLHLGLMAVTGDWYFPMLLGGQVFGIPAGVVVGVAGVSAWTAGLPAGSESA